MTIINNNDKSNMTLSVSHKFARNSIFNIAGFFVNFPILLLLTPLMLKILGIAQFGIWAIAGVVTSYAQLSDIGMTTAIVKFVAEHWIKKDIDRISKIASTTFFSFAITGGLVTSITLLLRNYIILNLLKVPAAIQSEALFVITWIILIFYFNIIFSVFNSLLLGIQRMDVTNTISITTNIFKAIGIYFFLSKGFGLNGLIVNSAIFSGITITLNIFWAKKLIKGVKINPLLFSFKEFKRVFKYSINILSANLISFGQDPISKIIIAAYTSLTFVAFYEIGNRIQQVVRQFFNIGLTPLLPAASELHSIDNQDEIKKIYFSISRILYLFATPLFLLIIILAKPLVHIWLGNGYEVAARAIQFILIGQFASLFVTPQYIILQGIEKPVINTYAHLLAAFLNISVSILLIPYMGFYGVLIGGIISLIVSALFIDFSFKYITGIKFKDYLTVIPIKGIFVTFLLAYILKLSMAYIGTIEIFKLLFLISSFLFIYLIALKFGRITNDRDWQMLVKVFRTLKTQNL